LTSIKPAGASRGYGEAMNSSSSFETLTQGVSAHLAWLRKDTPAVMKGFAELSRASMQSGALSEKHKELIALALGVGAHCDACIGFHAKALVRLGATRSEVEEALGVAVYMGGGPSLMYAANAIGAFVEFSQAGAGG
jgi:AhpD family alkylhydroperoxidase